MSIADWTASLDQFAPEGTAKADAENPAIRIEDLPNIENIASENIEYIRPELPRGCLIGFTGDSGCGKTSLLDAFSRDAWRDMRIPTLVLDRENPLPFTKNRLARVAATTGPHMRYWGRWVKEEAPMPDDPRVLAWAGETRGIIRVDSWTAFMEDGDTNSATDVRLLMNRSRKAADLGATVEIVHHDGKALTAKHYRGSRDFKDGLDCAYFVANSSNTAFLDIITLTPYKLRGAVDESSGGDIVYRYAKGLFIRENSAGFLSPDNPKLAGVLRMNPGVGMRRFEELSITAGVGRNTARDWLSGEVLAGRVKRESHGKGFRHFLEGER